MVLLKEVKDVKHVQFFIFITHHTFAKQQPIF